MNQLIDNYVSVLKNSLEFSGRASRGEYWWFMAMNVAAGIGLQLFDLIIGIPVLSIVFMLAMLLPGVAVSIRRLHDSDRSGWWLLVGLVPVLGAFAVLALMVAPGSKLENQFGTPPSPPTPFGQNSIRTTGQKV